MPRVEHVEYDVTIYSINELSEEAKQKAYDKFNSQDTYPYGDENIKTLKAFEDIFPVKVGDWEYGYRNSINFRFTGDDDVEVLGGIRLMRYIYSNYFSDLFKGKTYSDLKYNKDGTYTHKVRHSKVIFQGEGCCNLTGYYIDNEILQPIYDFLKKPDSRTFKELLEDCFNKWIKACNDDYEDYYSMRSFIEISEANDWEYTEDGKLWRG